MRSKLQNALNVTHGLLEDKIICNHMMFIFYIVINK
jgi:hypothetical protein